MIYIRLVSERWSPISAAIRFGTRGWPSHAELISVRFGTHEVADVIASRWPGGVLHYPYLTNGITREEWYTAPNIELAWPAMETLIGHRYDLLDILAIAGDQDWHNDGRYICSEAVAFAFERVGSPLLNPAIAVRRLTPRDLLLSPFVKFVARVR